MDASPVESGGDAAQSPRSSYWLTRFVILRLLGWVYLVGFLILVNQALPLFGSHGLTPAALFLRRVAAQEGSRGLAFGQLPSIFWLGVSDRAILVGSWIGAALSLALLLGYANAVTLAILWLLYMSFVNIGQDWYGYGWEIQLLETGFLAIFLCPLLDPRPFPRRPPPRLVIWLFRWLGFRIMLGAGLIKMRGDSCWRDLTCLYYHFETQPIPNPLSRTLHFLPHGVLKLGCLFNHFVELVVPWFMFGLPRKMETDTPFGRVGRIVRHTAGCFLVALQAALILSGNLAFLNWLTIVPMLACFDDGLLARLLPRRLAERARRAAEEADPSRVQQVVALLLTVLVAVLSIFPVANMVSSRQIMNTSFDPLHLVNTYGAFGSVGRQRYQIIFEGSNDGRTWSEYEYRCQPADPHRRPCVITPYHYRLDWQIWFAAMGSPQEYPWTVHLVEKLLHNDPGALSLLAGNPFANAPPRFVRAVLYRYRFAPPGNPQGLWWDRKKLGLWLPALSAHDPRLLEFLRVRGWGTESVGY